MYFFSLHFEFKMLTQKSEEKSHKNIHSTILI